MTENTYTVSYNGLSPWGTGVSGVAPFVSVDTEEIWAADKLGVVRTITLDGSIPSGGTAQISAIKNAFSSNLKAFSAPNVYSPCAIVQEITFSPQNYIGKVDYSVVLKDFSGFSSMFQVTDPVDEITFVDELDGSVTVNHRVSAVGIPSGTSARTLTNAVNFVRSKTGLSTINALTTSFVDTTNRNNIICMSLQENINRAAGSYSVSEVYKYDPLRNITNGVFKRFSVGHDSSISDDYQQISVDATYLVSKDTYDFSITGAFLVNELYSIATGVVSTINPDPVSLSITEEEINLNEVSVYSGWARSLSVKSIFDNSLYSSYFDYEAEGAKDYKNGVSQISINGTIIGSGRHVRRRFQTALGFYNGTVGGWDGIKGYLYPLVTGAASLLGYNSYSFNPTPKSISASFNSGQGTINISASFDDSPFVAGYTSFDWNVATDCGLNIFRPYASANTNGSYLIQNLNIVNRSSVNINGNFEFPSTGAFSPTSHITVLGSLRTAEGTTNAFLESETYNISSGEAFKTGYSYSYAREGCGLTALPANGSIYEGIEL